MSTTTIKIRRDTAARWAANNPTPEDGELCIVTDITPQRLKIGDGLTAFNSLPYFTLPNATTTAAGAMSAADKAKLNGIATGAVDEDTVRRFVYAGIGEAVRVTFNIASDGTYTLCDTPDLKLMAINDDLHFDGEATLRSGTYTGSFVFADFTEIPADAFSGVDKAEILRIPSYVHSIGNMAFKGTSIARVFCEAMTPPTVGTGAFAGLDPATMSLYVHKVVLDAYQADAFWGTFGTIDNF